MSINLILLSILIGTIVSGVICVEMNLRSLKKDIEFRIEATRRDLKTWKM